MFIQLKNISKNFGSFKALDDVSLEIKENEFFILLGPSGCGKTTLMRIIAGFETPSKGEVLIGEKKMNHLPPQKRPTNMVFQSYALFENMSVWSNVAYGLKIARFPRAEIEKRVENILKLTNLSAQKDKMPEQLSGGQRQRVALSRALVMEPEVLMLDEPLSALDAKLRNNMQEELVNLQKKVKVTFIMVTHDQNEALSIANRIAVMKNGVVDQVGTPEEIYKHPSSKYTADFVGTMNWFPVREWVQEGDNIKFEIDCFGEISFLAVQEMNELVNSRQDRLILGVRPENVRILEEGGSDSMSGNRKEFIERELLVKQEIYFGDYYKVNFSFPKDESGRTLQVFVGNEFSYKEGDRVKVRIDLDNMLIFPDEI